MTRNPDTGHEQGRGEKLLVKLTRGKGLDESFEIFFSCISCYYIRAVCFYE